MLEASDLLRSSKPEKMSGHSKWSKVKHQKAVTDVAKARYFTQASRGITLAVTEGGGSTNPDDNFRLRLAIEKARSVNMPKENIERAINRGKGQDGVVLERVVYEGYGPGGVAILVEGTTDNRNRTGQLVKNLFEKTGGSLASPGAVKYLFRDYWMLTVASGPASYDSLLESAIACGADDAVAAADGYQIIASQEKLSAVKSGLEKAGWVIEGVEYMREPQAMISVGSAEARGVTDLVTSLTELDDIHNVTTNLEADGENK